MCSKKKISVNVYVFTSKKDLVTIFFGYLTWLTSSSIRNMIVYFEHSIGNKDEYNEHELQSLNIIHDFLLDIKMYKLIHDLLYIPIFECIFKKNIYISQKTNVRLDLFWLLWRGWIAQSWSLALSELLLDYNFFL